MGGPRLTSWVDPDTGIEMRACRGPCGEEKPVGEFAIFADGKPRGLCRKCVAARKKRYSEEGRLKRRPREVEREVQRRWARENRDRRLSQHRAYLARVKADPERHAAFLETRRLAYRLKREREGVPLDQIRGGGTLYGVDVRVNIPSAPLVALVEGVLERRKAVAGLIHDAEGATLREVCIDLGTTRRTFARWRSGEMPTCRIATAERVIQAASVEWTAVYPLEDYPDLYAHLPESVA